MPHSVQELLEHAEKIVLLAEQIKALRVQLAETIIEERNTVDLVLKNTGTLEQHVFAQSCCGRFDVGGSTGGSQVV